MGFVVGAQPRHFAGYVGMVNARASHVRTAQAASHGLDPALQVAFKGGAVTGLLLIGLGLVALAGFYAIGSAIAGQEKAVHALISLGFGGSSFRFLPVSEEAFTPRPRTWEPTSSEN